MEDQRVTKFGVLIAHILKRSLQERIPAQVKFTLYFSYNRL